MTFRGTEIYISSSTFRCLRAIAKAQGQGVTADAVADKLLAEVIAKQWPALISLQNEIKELEKQMIDVAERN